MAGPFKCEICDVAFTRKQHVGRHMRSHTGDKPYQCKYCPDRFARSDLLSRHVNKTHGPPGPDGKPNGQPQRGSNGNKSKTSQGGQNHWNGTAMAQRRSIASKSGGTAGESEWEDVPYDGQEESGAMPLPYNLAPRPMDDLAKTFLANDRSNYPQQSYMQSGQPGPVSQNGNGDQQPQYQLSLNQPFMSGSDWATATPAQLQQQQQTQAAFDQQIAQLNAMAQLGLSNPYQGERQGYGELNLNVSPAQAQTELMNQSQMFTSPQYTSPAQDQQAMQYSLSSDGTISEPSRAGSQTAGNNMTPQQGFSFIPPLDPMTGQMLPGLDMDGGWTSMRAAGIDPIKKKRKTRACDRCNHSKTRCDSGSPCSRCLARRLSCHYSGPRAAPKPQPDSFMPAGTVPAKEPLGSQLAAAQARLRASTSPEQNPKVPDWVNNVINASPQPTVVTTSPQSQPDGMYAPTSVPSTRINSLTRSTPTLAFTESPETSDGASSLTGAVLGALDSRDMSLSSMYGQPAYESQPFVADTQQDLSNAASLLASPPFQQDVQPQEPKGTLSGQQAAAAVIHEAALADWQQRVGQISLQDNFAVPMPVNYPQAFVNAQLAKVKQTNQPARPGMNRQRSNSVPSSTSSGSFGYQPGQYGLPMASGQDGNPADPVKWAVPKLPDGIQSAGQANALTNGRRGSISRPAASVLQGQQLPMYSWQRPGQLQTLAPERPPSFLLTPMEGRSKKLTSALARPGNKRMPSTTLGPDDSKRQTTEADLEVDWRAYQANNGRRSSLPNWGTPTKYMDASLNMGGFPFSEENPGFPFPSPVPGLSGNPLVFDGNKMPLGVAGGMF